MLYGPHSIQCWGLHANIVLPNFMLRKLYQLLLLILMILMMVRGLVLVVRMVKEFQLPVQTWRPDSADEQLIWDNYQRVAR